MERKNTILLTVIAIATLLVAVVGATFAYFTASVGGTGNTDNKNTSTINTAVLASVEYNNGKNFALTNAYPGAKGVQTFTVTPTGDAGAKGKFVVTLTPDASNTLKTHVRYTLYKVKTSEADTKKVEVATVGTNLTDNKYTATDTFSVVGAPTVVGVANNYITNTTAITLDTVSFTMGTDDEAYTYYLAYEYENATDADQNAEQGQTFGAKVTVSLDNPNA